MADPIEYPPTSPQWFDQKHQALDQPQDVSLNDWLLSLGQLAQYAVMGRGGVGKWPGGVPKQPSTTKGGPRTEDLWQSLGDLVSKKKRDQWLAEIEATNPKAAEAIRRQRALNAAEQPAMPPEASAVMPGTPKRSPMMDLADRLESRRWDDLMDNVREIEAARPKPTVPDAFRQLAREMEHGKFGLPHREGAQGGYLYGVGKYLQNQYSNEDGPPPEMPLVP